MNRKTVNEDGSGNEKKTDEKRKFLLKRITIANFALLCVKREYQSAEYSNQEP